MNSYFDPGWQEDSYYKELTKNIGRLNTYKRMQASAWGADPWTYSTYSPEEQRKYHDWWKNELDRQYGRNFDDAYERYQALMSRFQRQ